METEIFNKLCDIERVLERIADALEKQNKASTARVTIDGILHTNGTSKETVRTWDNSEVDLRKLARIVEDHIRKEK